MTRAGMSWSDAELLALLSLRHVGHPFSAIPAFLAWQGFPDRTRNACLSMWHRLRAADLDAEAA